MPSLVEDSEIEIEQGILSGTRPQRIRLPWDTAEIAILTPHICLSFRCASAASEEDPAVVPAEKGKQVPSLRS